MQDKKFVTTIRKSDEFPYLGVFENEYKVADFSKLNPNATLISLNKKVKNIGLLPSFKKIKYINTAYINKETVELMAQLLKLEVVFISFFKQTEFPALKNLNHLKYLLIRSATKITSADFLNGMAQLKSLFISECSRLSDISAFSTLSNLKELVIEGDLHGNTSKIPDISAIFQLEKLEYLALFIKKAVLEARDFNSLKNLQEIYLNTNRYPFQFFAELEKYLPKNVSKSWEIFDKYKNDICEKCNNNTIIIAVGQRQRKFCTKCNEKKMKKLITEYESFSKNEFNLKSLNI